MLCLKQAEEQQSHHCLSGYLGDRNGKIAGLIARLREAGVKIGKGFIDDLDVNEASTAIVEGIRRSY